MTTALVTDDPAAINLRRLLADMHIVRQYLASSGVSLPSPTAIVCDVLASGVTGDGNSARYQQAGREMRRLATPPLEHRRLWTDELASLPGHSTRVYLVASVEVLDLSADPPKVAPLVVIEADKRERRHALTLAQRIGWVKASQEQAAKWAAAIQDGRKKQALDGMQVRGEAALALAAEEWAG